MLLTTPCAQRFTAVLPLRAEERVADSRRAPVVLDRLRDKELLVAGDEPSRRGHTLRHLLAPSLARASMTLRG